MHESLTSLTEALHPLKARTALRVLFAGRPLTPATFQEQAHPLSRRELTAVERFSRDGLTTRVAERVPSSDGSIRLVVRLRDGETVETVAMPVRAVCISTQVGCAVACRFCASGLFGLKRNLTVDEIVEQVIHARREMRIDRVVYMGMGEPSHNLANVLDAVAMLKQHGWISPYKQTFSTVGSVKTLRALATARVKPCLALSLHSADPVVRRELLPNAVQEPLRDLVAAAAAYGRVQTKPVVFEWTLLAGINDRDEDVDQLAALLQGIRGYVNFIRWNPVDGLPFEPTSFARAVELREAVKSRGILATIRASTGHDVDAACGQLRRRSLGARTTASS